MKAENLRGISPHKQQEVINIATEKNLLYFINWEEIQPLYDLLDDAIKNALSSTVSTYLNEEEKVPQVTAGMDVPELNNFWTHFFPGSLLWKEYLLQNNALPDYLIRFIKLHPDKFRLTVEVVILTHYFFELDDEELVETKRELLWEAFNLMKDLVGKNDRVLGRLNEAILIT